MTLKAIKKLGIFFIFFICFPFHFLYDLAPNFLISIFFPVNESIWEHMKLITTSYYIYSIIELLLLKKNNIKVNNYLLQIFLTPVVGIILYISIFLPIYSIIGETIILSIGLLFAIIIIEQIFSYYLLTIPNVRLQNFIGIIGIIVTIIAFSYLTYNPIYIDLFKDTTTNFYGIKKINAS